MATKAKRKYVSKIDQEEMLKALEIMKILS